MTGVLAMMRTSLRLLVRSRLALLMLLAVLAADAALPLTIRGDGTLEGLIRLHLTYTLGSASFLLGLFSLWTGCGGIAREAETRTLQLLVVKPVPRLSIWLGKWFALLALDAALLAVAVSASAATLAVRLRSPAFTDAERAATLPRTLVALAPFRAPLPDVESEVRADYDRLRAAGRLPDAPESTLLSQIRRNVLARTYALPPGGSRTWRFERPAHLPADTPVWLGLRCDSSLVGSAETALDIRPGHADAAPLPFRFIPGIPRQLPSPLSLGSYSAPDGEALALTLTNRDPNGATLFFDPEEGAVLRVRSGTFAGNLLKAALLLYGRSALLAALGLTLGTLFSMPVATFAAFVLLVLLQLSGFIGSVATTDRAVFVANVAPFGAGLRHHGHDDATGTAPDAAATAEADADPSVPARAAATVLYAVYRTTWTLLRPLLEDSTVDRLATATAIPPREVVHALLRQLLLLPLLLGALSAAVLRTREWALPAES